MAFINIQKEIAGIIGGILGADGGKKKNTGYSGGGSFGSTKGYSGGGSFGPPAKTTSAQPIKGFGNGVGAVGNSFAAPQRVVNNTTTIIQRAAPTPAAAPAAAPKQPEAPKLDARELFGSLLETYGFNSAQTSSLLGEVNGWINKGIDYDTIATAFIPTSKAYKERFKANDARTKAGMGALSPAQYIAQESGYRQVLSMNGLPSGFFDSQDDFSSWIANDVSVDEIASRAKGASDLANKTDAKALSYLQTNYGIGKGDIAAAFLDRRNGVAYLEKIANASRLGGEALRQGLNIGRQYSEELTNLNVTQDTARQAFGVVAGEKDTLAKLATIDKTVGGSLTTRELIDDTLGLDAKATKKVTGLKSQERARFSGSSSGTSAFGANTSGKI